MNMPEVDRSFMKDLKSLDKRLSVVFNGQNFVVRYDRGYGQPVNIFRIKGRDDGFRQPDRRDLEVIKGGDLETEKMETRLKKSAYAAECLRRETARKASENIRHMTLDDKNQLQKAFIQKTNASKGNAAFRRIDHKPSKNVVSTA
jgi:hypothetical protein